MNPRGMSMVEFYRIQAFNPVLIPVEDERVWESHVRKRRNLYERHLGLPITLLEGRRVLEFGCNSGENGLVLAASGAELTFVEPNVQVLPRLRDLFTRMGLEGRIQTVHETDLQGFETDATFDLVIAEGFMSTLEDRDRMLAKLLRFVKPKGFGVISYNDRCGGLLEMLKRAVLFRAYALLDLKDIHSTQALQIAQDLFLEDFQKLKASRTFEAWWKDTMVAPVYTDRQLWSFPEILAVLQAHGAAVHGTSPRWSAWEDFTWYKNAPEPDTVNARFLEEWKRHLAYFVTGFTPEPGGHRLASDVVIASAEALVQTLSGMAEGEADPATLQARGEALLTYLRDIHDPRFTQIAQELASLFQALGGCSADELLRLYRRSDAVRCAWGTAYHYLCFRRLP